MSGLVAQTGIRPPDDRGSVPRILVVDDEQHMCDVCSRTLRRGGYDVVTTSEPQRAVELLRGDSSFDLLLTDIKMPSMSGLDLAHVAHERDPAMAVIIMTGFASMENLHQSVQRGVADFLSKPFELDQLRLAVDQALHKRSLLQDNLRLRALEQLVNHSRSLAATLELAELTAILLRIGLKQTGCAAGFVLLGETETTLHLMSASAPESQLTEAGRQLAERALAQHENVIGSGDLIGRLAGRELRYALAVPLRAQKQVTGVLLLCDERPTRLLPGIQEELTLLASYAGSALRNASLYRELGEAFQRLQELDRLKSEFIAIASHELRTPLSIILGYTMMMRDQQVGDQRDYLQRVMESAQRIKEIVDDMVSLRHLDTGEAQPVAEECDLNDVIATAVDRMQTSAAERAQTIAVELPDQPLSIQCDRERILLIVGHLISNAIKFSPEAGQIAVRARPSPGADLAEWIEQTATYAVAPPLDPAPVWVVVEVQDDGIGIAEPQQRRIFERFYQVADSLTRDHGGTGLGLAIVRELIGALGGAVWVTSREHQGSTFAFALPVRQPEPPVNAS
jgi:signal transduction histidine kinase